MQRKLFIEKLYQQPTTNTHTYSDQNRDSTTTFSPNMKRFGNLTSTRPILNNYLKIHEYELQYLRKKKKHFVVEYDANKHYWIGIS